MKKLLSTLLCIAVVVGCMPTMAFAAGGDQGNPDVLTVKMGTSTDDLISLTAQRSSSFSDNQYYDLTAEKKHSLDQEQFLYLKVERREAYREDTSEKMSISYQIGDQYYEIEPTVIDNTTIKIPASQLRLRDYGDYDLIIISVKYKDLTYYYKGKFKDLFTSSSDQYDKFNLEKYVGYYTSESNTPIGIFKTNSGRIKARIYDEVDDKDNPYIGKIFSYVIQDKDGKKQSETLHLYGDSVNVILQISEQSLVTLGDYSYRKEADDTSKTGKIAKGAVYTRTTAAIAMNERTRESYPSLDQAMAVAHKGDKLRLLKDVTTRQRVDIDTEVTLDLNGKTVTAAENFVQPFFMLGQGKLTVENSGSSGGIIVNVTPANAQKAINYAVDYTTINFARGSYEKLEIRNRTIDKVVDGDKEGRYRRSLRHISFVGQPGNELKNITVQPGHNATDKKMVDYQTGADIVVNECNGYMGRIDLSDITFDSLNFVSGDNLPGIDLAYWGNGPDEAIYGTVDKLDIKNCSFNLSNTGANAAAIKIVEQGFLTYGKIKIENNVVERAYQAVYLTGCGAKADIQISGNVFKNTVHNAVAIQGSLQTSQDNRVRGKMTVESNFMENVTDRVFRLGAVLSSAEIKINNNIILDAGDDKGELIKDDSIEAGAKINLEHNYWQLKEGVTLDQAIAGNLQMPASTGVISGTFSRDVSQYVGAGYESVCDGSGRYAVKEIYRPSIPPVKPDVTTENTEETTTTRTEAQITTSGDEITATITDQTAKKLVEQAVAKNADEVAIEIPTGEKSVVKAQLQMETIKEIAEKTDAALTIKASRGEISFDNKALNTILEEAAGDKLSIIAEVVEDSSKNHKEIVGDDGVLLDLKVFHENGYVTEFGRGKVTVAMAIPDQLLAKNVKAVYLADDGAYVTLPGEDVTKNEKRHYRFETGHFSRYAIANAETVDQYFARIKAGVKKTKLNVWSSVKKGSITVKWKKSAGFKVDYYQVFRSTKKNIGYGTKAFYVTKTGTQKSYKNTKQLKKGTRYYYKVRGVRVLDGKKVYTQYSNKACRIAK